MAITFTTGNAFSSGDTVTATKLNNTVNAMTVTGITSGSLLGRTTASTGALELVSQSDLFAKWGINSGVVTQPANGGMSVGGTGITTSIIVGQSDTANLSIVWSYNATEASATAALNSTNALQIQTLVGNLVLSTQSTSNILLQTSSGGNVQLGAPSSSSATTAFPVLTSNSGAPTGAASNGSIYLDATNSKLYVRIGGAWKSTTLT